MIAVHSCNTARLVQFPARLKHIQALEYTIARTPHDKHTHTHTQKKEREMCQRKSHGVAEAPTFIQNAVSTSQNYVTA